MLVPLITIIIGIFMVVLDGTAVNVALQRLVVDFKTPLSTVQWTVTGYTLAQAAVIPLAGWLSDRFGAKYIFLTSVALFTLGSVLCATAQGADALIAFRVLQGIGGGCVIPIAMAYTFRLSPPEKVGLLMAIMGIPTLFAPAIGPVLAGWLVQYHSWRWIFLLNLPVGITGVTLGIRSLPKIERQTVAALDLTGMILAPLAFAALCYGISEGSTSWTSVNTIGGIVVGVVALVLFVVAELRARRRCSSCASSSPWTSAWRSLCNGSRCSACSAPCCSCRSSCKACAATAPSIPASACCRWRLARRWPCPSAASSLTSSALARSC